MPAQVVKSGSENVVIGPDAVFDDSPASVVFGDGSYAVIWFRGDGANINELNYQRFDASGNQFGAPKSLEHGSTGFSFINASLLPNGNVAIAYQDNYGANAEIKMTIVNQSGTTILAPAVIATTIAGEQSDTAITTLKINGVDQILVTWEDWKGSDANAGTDSAIRARFLNLDGSASSLGATDFQVNTVDTNATTGNLQLNADVAASPNGGGVIVWTDESNSDGYTTIKFRVIDSTTGALGAEQYVHDQAFHQEHATVAYLPDGKFVVAYAYNTVDSPAHQVEIRTKIFNANGTQFSASTAATTAVEGSHKVHPNIEVLQDGGFVITWTEVIDGVADQVWARACNANGTPVGNALRVSTSPVGDEFESETLILSDGRVLVLYGEDGYEDIHAQIVDARLATVQTSANVRSIEGEGSVQNLVFIGAGNFKGTGNTLANTITGGDGNDRLDGGTGADTLIGGLGNDTYVVDNVNDAVNEALGAGTDTVWSSVSYVLAGNIENLTLGGGGNINGAGNSLNNGITGNSGANTLNGGAGNDTLNGGAGADTMSGGSGNDMYVVGAGDTVTEVIGGGVDTVQTALNAYNLPNAVELLVFTGAGNFTALGNADANRITGGTGDDFLNGGGGADQLYGGLGNDTYVADISTDLVFENVNGGTDTVQASTTYTLGANIENLTLIGIGNINGSGNALNNILRGTNGDNGLYGGTGNDSLIGNGGNDKLYGGAGADYLHGGAGQDAFVLNTAIGAGQSDSIADFNVADDTIWLENAIFTKLTVTGTLSAATFVVGAAAADANDYVIYNKATGALFYDSNGNAAGGSTQIATLSANLALTHQDFLVI